MILALTLISGILSHTDVNVVLQPDSDATEAHVRIVIYSGSAEDPAGKEGLAWATARTIRDRAGSLGGLAVSVERDVTILSAAVDGGQLDAFLNTMAPILIDPIATGPAIDIERSGLQERPRAGTSEDAFDAILFAGHPHGHPPRGSPESRGRIGERDLAGFQAAHYRKGNLAIGLAGPVDGSTRDHAISAFDRLAEGEPSRTHRHPSYPTTPRVFVIEDPGTARSLLRIGLPLSVTRGHPDHADLLLAASCLDSLPGPVTFRIGSDRFGRRLGALRTAVETGPGGAAGGLRDAMGLLVNALIEGLPAGCPASAASKLEESIRSRAASPEGALELRLSEFLHGEDGRLERSAADLSAPTRESVASALSRHVFPESLSVLAVVPDAPVFIERLRSVEIPGWPSLGEADFQVTTFERVLSGGI